MIIGEPQLDTIMALLPNCEGMGNNKKTKCGMDVTYIMLNAEVICGKFDYLVDWHGNVNVIVQCPSRRMSAHVHLH